MKVFISCSVSALLLAGNAFSQQCPPVSIQSSVVAKPSGEQISYAARCDEVQVRWKGHPDQAYVFTGTYTDKLTGSNSTIRETSVTWDNELNCYFIAALKPGTTLSWTVQAVQVIDGRTFYSYPLRGEAAGCEVAGPVEITTQAPGSDIKPGDFVTAKNTFIVFPNPVTGELSLNWRSDYKGSARLIIMDASGKLVRTAIITKEQVDYADRINVHALSAGVHFLHIQMADGRSVSTRFVKK